MATRLQPTVTLDTEFFWNGLKEGKLLVQRCSECGALRHPPRPMCPHCNSLEWQAIEATGRGTVHSFVMPRHPPFPWFDDDYIVALIDLDEGVRIVSNLVDVTPDDAAIGMPVEVQFETFDDGLVLPLFTASSS
jgi:uncharacterized OB-fold protein